MHFYPYIHRQIKQHIMVIWSIASHQVAIEFESWRSVSQIRFQPLLVNSTEEGTSEGVVREVVRHEQTVQVDGLQVSAQQGALHAHHIPHGHLVRARHEGALLFTLLNLAQTRNVRLVQVVVAAQ